ncbi:hypothetical protein PVAP13_5NG402700 [Panicum virgatum]|uniref:Uncharacterized protein n=1 Tax=Panicum virgatum TaxID=38727 RepID=A0A8T0S0T6_PANVG|nr:hypothetical protein PVAP13_5NG402700 [Panicum virgatum]
MAFVPVCVQCGTRSNPCRCKVLGPTLGFVAFVVAGVIEWPLGAAVYLFRHRKGRRIMAHPATASTRASPAPSPSDQIRRPVVPRAAPQVIYLDRCRLLSLTPCTPNPDGFEGCVAAY